MKKLILPIVILFAVISISFSQPWLVESQTFKSTKGEPTFKESQAAFNAYYKNKEVAGAKGQKQFRRWEFIMEPRLSNSSFLDSKSLWKAINDKPALLPDDSADWMFVGPETTPYEIQTTRKSGNGRLNCVAFHPTDEDIIYVGAPSGGFWKTSNGGLNWTTTTDKLDAIGISDIVISHVDPQIIYLATGDGDAGDTYGIGIIKSTDGGNTWDVTNLSLDAVNGIYFRRILMNPEDENIMIASSNNGIYRTTDGWNTYDLQLSDKSFRDLEYKPGQPDTVYATTYSYGGAAKVYRSTNGGISFNDITSSLGITGVNRIELAVTPANPEYVYALASKSSNSGLHSVHRSTNSGTDWNEVLNDSFENLLGWNFNGSDDGGQGWYDLSLAVSPTNENVVLAGGVNIWRSTDGGTNWDISSMWYHGTSVDYVHADQHMFAYSQLNGNLYTANDGGLYFTEDDGLNWSDISNDIQILQSYHFGISQLSDDKIITGNQDNGTFLSTNSEWFAIIGGDGMQCHIDPGNDDILYGSIYYGDIYKSVDGGLNFSNIRPAGVDDGAWVTPYILHPTHPNIIYAGYKNVYKSTDRGLSWNVISPRLSNSNLNEVAVAPSSDDFVFASQGRFLYKTGNNGADWDTISSGLPSEAITSICISPNDHNEIWVSLSGYSDGNKVYYTADGGATWNNYSTGLPNVPANDIIYREGSNKELYLATDIGVYYRNADSDTWISYSNNLPNVIVTDLQIAKNFNKLKAATYGRGVWETVLEPIIPSKIAVSTDLIYGCTDAPIMVSYAGEELFDSLKWGFDNATIITEYPNNDTVIISYPETGLKTVTLYHYLDGVLTTENNYNFHNIGTTLSFDIYPDMQYVCNDAGVDYYLPPGYTYSIDPSDGATFDGNILTLQPSVTTDYTLTAIHGLCSTDREISIAKMPDDICDAIVLPVGVSGPFSNSCATSQIDEPFAPVGTGNSNGCISQNGWCEGEDVVRNSVWFKIPVTQTGKIAINVRGFDSKIALYETENCIDLQGGKYTLLAANDDTDGNQFGSSIYPVNDLTPDDTLYLQVDGSFGGAIGEFTVEIIDYSFNSTNRIEEIHNITLYPNPAQNEFTVRMIVPESSVVDVDVFDETGKLILSKPGMEDVSFYEEKFDAPDMNGLYFVRIKTKNQVIMRKLIIQK